MLRLHRLREARLAKEPVSPSLGVLATPVGVFPGSLAPGKTGEHNVKAALDLFPRNILGLVTSLWGGGRSGHSGSISMVL